jgi:SH3-like domain-containing protein
MEVIMRKTSRVNVLVIAGILVCVSLLLADVFVIKVKSTQLRKEPKFYSPVIATLHSGETVESIAVQESWYKVRTQKGLIGWIHSCVVQKKGLGLLAMNKTLKTGATADEVALAGKGFNKQVEANYKKKNARINFAAVDKMLQQKFSMKKIQEFLKKGKLGDFGGAQ